LRCIAFFVAYGCERNCSSLFYFVSFTCLILTTTPSELTTMMLNSHLRVLSVGVRTYATAIARKGRGGRVSISGQTVTVFGATGFLGRYVVNELGKRGNQIVVAQRPGEMNSRHLRPCADVGQLQFFEHVARDYESCREAVKHSDVVINMIGSRLETRNFSFSGVHVDLAKNVARACAEENIDRLVHFSSLNADPQSPSEFLKTKARGEEAVLKEFPNATILRPATMYGVEDKFFNKLCFLLKAKYLTMCHLDTKKSPVYVGDVARAAVNAAFFDDNAAGKIYELCGPETYTMDHITSHLIKETYRNPKIIEVDAKYVEMMAALIQKVSIWDPKITVDEVQRLGFDEVPGNLPGLNDLGIENPGNFEKDSIKFYRRFRDFKYYDEVAHN